MILIIPFCFLCLSFPSYERQLQDSGLLRSQPHITVSGHEDTSIQSVLSFYRSQGKVVSIEAGPHTTNSLYQRKGERMESKEKRGSEEGKGMVDTLLFSIHSGVELPPEALVERFQRPEWFRPLQNPLFVDGRWSFNLLRRSP